MPISLEFLFNSFSFKCSSESAQCNSYLLFSSCFFCDTVMVVVVDEEDFFEEDALVAVEAFC